ncbi:MAG: EAL domain-containing protein [Lachnospiraceae bacterium]|nr:EAL domain-containing protein [Lachnospiraceae bacterium]
MTNQKIYKKIKKSGVAGSLILFLIMWLLTVGVIVFSAYRFAEYVRDTKLNTEYDAASYIDRLYEEGLEAGMDTDTLYRLLETNGRDYLITDTEDNVLHVFGEDTHSPEAHPVRIALFSRQIIVYTDAEKPYVRPDAKGQLTIDFRTLRELIQANDLISFSTNRPDNLPEDDMDPLESRFRKNIHDLDARTDGLITYYTHSENGSNERFIELPFWIAFNTGSGAGRLIIKSWFSINVRDLILLGEITAALFVLVIAIMLYSLISLVRTFRRQKRIVNYFFTDPITGGNNWMWYQIKGDQLLKKWHNRSNNYAVVNLVMVNYSNYCVCHTVASGERLLSLIYAEIKKSLNKKEMCAHNTSASYAMILRYEDANELKARIAALISRLETIEPDHRFNFQAGISLIDTVLDENDKPVRRKNVNIQDEFSNAGTARASLSDSDESGIAFFDDKIVEDQRWLDRVQEKQAQAVANEEFLVYYQPKYDPRTSELRGAEALIRWQSPDFGFVAPNRFIPIFEKNGFITEIDHYMLSHVARDQRRWLDAGYKCVPVSVNVSRAHFIENDLAEQIRDIVGAANCPHELIELELTESAFFDDKKTMIETINKLKSFGFAVSMDDFGAGYSSLNSLKDMPLDVLKLDADFFRGESSDGRGEIVVSEAIRLAKSLNMRIVAEGVEVREQVDFLAGEGCDMIQGFYFAKPMPGNDFEVRMSQKTAPIAEEPISGNTESAGDTTDPENTGDTAEDKQ